MHLEEEHYIGYSSHYIHICIVHIEKRKERQKSDTERHGIPPQSIWFFYLPGVQLRYTVPVHAMDIYNDKMNDMWEPAPGIEDPGLPLERRAMEPLDHCGSPCIWSYDQTKQVELINVHQTYLLSIKVHISGFIVGFRSQGQNAKRQAIFLLHVNQLLSLVIN